MCRIRRLVAILVFCLTVPIMASAEDVYVELTIEGVRITLPDDTAAMDYDHEGSPISTWTGGIYGISIFSTNPFAIEAYGDTHLLEETAGTPLTEELLAALDDPEDAADPTYVSVGTEADPAELEFFATPGEFDRDLLFEQEVTADDNPGTYKGTIKIDYSTAAA